MSVENGFVELNNIESEIMDNFVGDSTTCCASGTCS